MGEESLYQQLVERCRSLEESHARLKGKVMEIIEEEDRRRRRSDTEVSEGCYTICNLNRKDSSWQYIPGFFTSGSPFKSVLKCIGYAVCVSCVSSGKIVFWNRAAEILYGWEEREAVGRFMAEIMVTEDHRPPLMRIMERTCYGHTWHGQFVFKKKWGETFKALTSSSPLYDEDKLVGVITATCDAEVFNLATSGALGNSIVRRYHGFY